VGGEFKGRSVAGLGHLLERLGTDEGGRCELGSWEGSG